MVEIGYWAPKFFQDVFVQGGQDGPFSRAMLGQIGLTQLMAELDEDCKKVAAASGLSLPDKFSVAQGFEAMTNEELLDSPLLRAALTLQNNGFKIAVLTNIWIDDSPQRHRTAHILCLLRKYFDAVIESCRIGLQKPDPKIYEYTLEVLKAKPQEVIFLDDIGANLKPAREMGMATILVRDADSALKELQDLTGIQDQFESCPKWGARMDKQSYIETQEQEEEHYVILYAMEAFFKNAFPSILAKKTCHPPCDPENVAHGYVTIKPGTQLHFVELGNGPPVCLCHGFPESWFSWRHQIPALADAGFRVLALEMKGYGISTAPPGDVTFWS
ncbi:UNVERIFIED_CONTAM: hypothetical protein K2H54_034093 [Gekko kuhli]